MGELSWVQIRIVAWGLRECQILLTKIIINMGTRNSIIVRNENSETKVAQYGQWDGYPSGVGVGVLGFLRNEILFDKFKNNLSKVRFLDEDGQDKKFIEDYNNNCPVWSRDPDKRTDEQIHWHKTYISRDLADEVLVNIANSQEEEIVLISFESSAGSDGPCEYCYVIDMKENTFDVRHSLDSEPIKTYQLSDLPTEKQFLRDLKNNN